MRRQGLSVAAGPELAFSPAFLDSFSEQLIEQAQDLTGLDLSRFFLACEAVRSETQGETLLEADLVGPDNFGQPVIISWRCKAHPGEHIQPSNPLKPAEGHQLEVRWILLPVEELRSRYLEPPPPHTIDVGDVSFQIEWSPWWKPPTEKLTFELLTQRELSGSELKEAERALWNAVTDYPVQKGSCRAMAEDWSLSEDEVKELVQRGFANFWTGIRLVGGQEYHIGVDFLFMNDEIVAQWLRALNEVSGMLALVRVRVQP